MVPPKPIIQIFSRYFKSLLLCRAILKIRNAKSSSRIDAFIYPMIANWARAKRANIGCSRV